MCRCGFRWDVGTGTRCPWGRLPIPSHAKAPWCPRRHPLGSAACSWKPSSVCWQDMNRHHRFCDRTAPSSGVRTCGGNGLCFSASGRFSLAPFPKPCAVRSSGCSPMSFSSCTRPSGNCSFVQVEMMTSILSHATVSLCSEFQIWAVVAAAPWRLRNLSGVSSERWRPRYRTCLLQPSPQPWITLDAHCPHAVSQGQGAFCKHSRFCQTHSLSCIYSALPLVCKSSPDSTWTEGCVPENFAVSTGLVALNSGDQKVVCGARGEQAGGPVLPPTPGKSSADTASHLMMTVLGFV